MYFDENVNFQYLGFGVPAAASPGRRAAHQEGVAHMVGGLSNAAEDNAEMDAFLRQVEARDMIEFGMIPVSTFPM